MTVNTVTRNFFLLTGLATLGSGGLWQQAVAFDAGQLSPLGVVFALVSLIVLLSPLFGTIRILYKTAPANRPTPDSRREENNA